MHMIANEGSTLLFSGAIAQSVDREIMPLPEEQEVSDICIQLVSNDKEAKLDIAVV